MNETVNKFLLAGDKLMPEMHLRQLGFTYIVCAPFTKKKENFFKETWNSRYICKNKLDQACFQNNMTCGILRICSEEQLLIKHSLIEHLLLLKI